MVGAADVGCCVIPPKLKPADDGAVAGKLVDPTPKFAEEVAVDARGCCEPAAPTPKLNGVAVEA